MSLISLVYNTKKLYKSTLLLVVILSLSIFCSSEGIAYYDAGETLNPSCFPGAVGCDVDPILQVNSGGTGLQTFGLDGQVLMMSGGAITWGDVSGSGPLGASIETSELTDGAVTSAKILDGAISTTDLADGSITTVKIADGNVTSVKIANGAISTTKLADDSITSAKIVDGAVNTQDLADNAVTTAKITDANVTTAKLADGSITSAKISDGTIVTVDIANDAITSAKLVDNAVTTTKITDGNVTSIKIASDAVTTAKILDGTITNADINAAAAIAWSKIDKTGSKLSDVADVPAYTGNDGKILSLSSGIPTWVDQAGIQLNGSTLTLGVSGLSLNLSNANAWTALQTFNNGITLGTGSVLNANSNKITNLATPTDITDATNKAYVDTLASGITWRSPILALANGAPATSNDGDRYVVNDGTASSATGCAQYDIAERVSGAWTCTTPSIGWSAYATTPATNYNYNGTTWVSLGSTVNHATLASLQGGQSGQYYHLNAADYGALTSGNAQLIQLQTTGSPTFSGLSVTGAITAQSSTNTINGLVINAGALSGLTGMNFATGAYNYDQSTSTGTFKTGTGAVSLNGNTTIATGKTLAVTDMTSGSLLYAGAGGAVSQNNAKLYWDSLNYRLGIGTATPDNALSVNGGVTLSSATPNTITNALYNQSGLLYWNGNQVSTGFINGATTSNSVFKVGTNSSSGNPYRVGTWTVPNSPGGYRMNIHIYGQGQYSSGMRSQEADVILQVNNDDAINGQWYSMGDTNGGNAISSIYTNKTATGTFEIWINGGQYFSSFVSASSSDGTFATDGITQNTMPGGAIALTNQAAFNQAGGLTTFGGAVAYKKGTDFTTVGTSTNIDFGNGSLIRLTGPTAQTLDTVAGGVDGKILTLVNNGAAIATIKDNSTASGTNANKVFTGTGADISLAVNASLMMIYDSGSSRWRVIGGTGSGGSSSNAIQTLSAAGSVTNWNYTVKTDATTASFVGTLPTAASNTGKQIEIVKTDNSLNTVSIAPFDAETINGSTNRIYLYSQGDSVVIRSDGTNSYIVADNRGSVGSSKSYMRATIPVGTITATANNPIVLNTVDSYYGSDISLNTSTGVFTLKAGKTYRLRGSAGISSALETSRWKNMTTVSYIGTGGAGDSTNPINDMTGVSEAIIIPTADTTVALISFSSTTLGETGNTLNRLPWADIEVISTPQNVINTVDYAYAVPSSSITAANTDIPFTLKTGNISLSSTQFTLLAGKTYQLTASMDENASTVNNAYFEYQWVDASNTALPNSVLGESSPVNSSNTHTDVPATAIITPSTNMVVKLRTTGAVGNVTSLYVTASYAQITQIGSTASTGVVLNSLIGAISAGALDNANNAQSWSWGTATTQTGMTMNANVLTSGGVESLSTSSTAFTGNVLGLSSTGNNAAVTGALANLSITGASSNAKGLNIANAGTGISMNVQGAVSFKAGTDFSTIGTTNDAAFGNASLIRLTGASAQTITGIKATDGTNHTTPANEDGRILTIMNTTANNATISNVATGSVAGNRILTGTGSDLSLAADASILLQYDATAASNTGRWRVIGGSGGGSGTTTFATQTTTTTLTSSAYGSTQKLDATTGSIAVTLPAPAGNSGKSIEFVKVDNTTNSARIIPNASETIAATSALYLYSQNDAVILRSDGTNWQIISDNRSSVGAGAQYGENTGITDTQTTTSTSYVDVTGSSFTLPAAGTWQVSYHVSAQTSTSGNGEGIEFALADTSNTVVPNSLLGWETGVNTINNTSYQTAQITTTGAATYKLRWKVTSGAGTGTLYNNATATVSGNTKISWEQLSTPQNVINTVDYVNVSKTTATAVSVSDVVFNSIISGNIAYNTSTGYFSLKAGKTYQLSASFRMSSAGGMNYMWVDTSNNNISTAYGSADNGSNNSDGFLSIIYTPTVDKQVKVRLTAGSGTLSANQQWATVTQIGSTASTGLTMNQLLAASAAGAIDNLNFAQAWNWSTDTTQTALTMGLNGLTTGTGLAITSNSASLNSTNGLLYVANTGASTNGVVFRVQSNSTAGSGLTVLANGRVGIGTANPTNGALVIENMDNSTGMGPLVLNAGSGNLPTRYAGTILQMVGSANTTTRLEINSFGGSGSGLTLRQANGTPTAPTAVANGDTIGFLNASGYNGTTWLTTQRAGVGFYSAEDWNATNNGTYMTFSTTPKTTTSAVEAMRITDAGKVGIGMTNPTRLLDISTSDTSNTSPVRIVNSGNANTANGLAISAGSNSVSGANLITFTRPDGTQIGSITQNAATTVAFNTTSDQRLKENIKDTSYGVLDLMKINIRDFDYKNDPNHKTVNGFVAQELQKIYPDAVTVGSDEVDDKGNLVNPWSVDYGRLTPLIIKSIQDQQELIATNTAMITALDMRTNNVFSGSALNAVDDKLAKTGATLNDISAQLASINAKLDSVSLASSSASISIKDIENQDAITFKNTVTFQGPAFFRAAVAFIEKIVFKNDVEFEGTPIYNKDTAGYAKILKGQTSVDVKFEKEYAVKPVVNVTAVGLNHGMQYAVTDISSKGFTIQIDPSQNNDITFNWMAVAVKDATTQESKSVSAEPTVTVTPTSVPVLSVTPTIIEPTISVHPTE